MIVRCPECSTGFKLPADRVGPKGAKVRCTKCDHVFRVRITDGDPEIFYKPGEEPAKSGPAFSEFGNQTAFGGPNSLADEDSEVGDSEAHTSIGRPGDVANLRATPQKPLASISGDEGEESEATDRTQRAGPLGAAGIVNKQRAGIVNKRKISRTDDEGFVGPGAALSESDDDSTSIGKPTDGGYTPKATSFGLPAVGSDDDEFDDDPFADEESDPEDAATNFGLPGRDKTGRDKTGRDEDDGRAFGDSAEDDDDLRGTAFGRPAFQEAQDAAEPDEPEFGENPKGTLFGLPAVADDDVAEDKPTVEVDGNIDLFDDESEPSQTEIDPMDEDPFAGAFEDQIDSSKNAIEVDPSLTGNDFEFDDTERADPPGFGQDEDSFGQAFSSDDSIEPSADDSGDFFGGGGGGSDFGDPSDFVDPEFGQDSPSFDPGADEDEQSEGEFGGGADDEFDFDTGPAQGVDLVMETEPPPAAERERAKTGKANKAASKKGGPKAAVPTSTGSSPDSAGFVQKFMNLMLIVMIVLAAFVGFVASKTGGVVDFGRVDHMLGIVFDGNEFEPRPEWGLETRTADDIVPLQTSQVIAYPTTAADGEPLVVSGKVENKGTSTFSGVKISVALVGPEGSILTEQTVPAGTRLEARKLKKLKVVKAHEAIIRQMSTMEPNSEIPFVAVFEELPTNSIEELEVLVDVAEKTEVKGAPSPGNASDSNGSDTESGEESETNGAADGDSE